MKEYYCYRCAAKYGILPSFPENFSATENTYKLEKFIKHTIPPDCSGTISIFDEPNCEKYKNYIVNTMASGCVEIDEQGRKNIVWMAGKETGFTFVDGELKGPTDGVKVVLPDNPQKLHAYPTGSCSLRTEKCKICGEPVIR